MLFEDGLGNIHGAVGIIDDIGGVIDEFCIVKSEGVGKGNMFEGKCDIVFFKNTISKRVGSGIGVAGIVGFKADIVSFKGAFVNDSPATIQYIQSNVVVFKNTIVKDGGRSKGETDTVCAVAFKTDGIKMCQCRAAGGYRYTAGKGGYGIAFSASA